MFQNCDEVLLPPLKLPAILDDELTGLSKITRDVVFGSKITVMVNLLLSRYFRWTPETVCHRTIT